MVDPFGEARGSISYQSILERLHKINEQLGVSFDDGEEEEDEGEQDGEDVATSSSATAMEEGATEY